MKNLASARLLIFSLWIGFWFLSAGALLFAPRLRPAIGYDQVFPALGSISSVWLPVVSCLAGFWFPRRQRTNARRARGSRERILGAVVLTLVYLTFVFILICWSAYFVDYTGPEFTTLGELPKGLSFQEQLDSALKSSLWLSPLATMPVIWLTGAPGDEA